MKDSLDTFMGYFTAGVLSLTAYIDEALVNINWMTVGAALLLVSRLAKDVPDGMISLLNLYKRMRGTYVTKDKSN